MQTYADSPDDPRHLMLLDALGEATPEQRARLADALRADPALAAEHAAMRSVASRLSEPAPAAISPMPTDLATRLDTMHTPPAKNVIAFSAFRRFAPLAAAAAVALLAGVWWLANAPTENSRPLLAQRGAPDAPDGVPETLALSGPAAPAVLGQPGTKRALIVAVEPWPEKEKNPKRGSGWADAQLAKKTLIESWGFLEKDIVVLHEDAATTKNVVETFRSHLITPSQPNDIVVLCWSSHGTQVQDFNGDEPDGLDEAYCTKDFAWNKPETWFTDDLLGTLLDQLPTKRALVITDACHSGTSTRGSAEADGEENIAKGISAGFAPLPVPLAGKTEERAPVKAVLLAACKAEEVAYGVVGKPSHFYREIFALTAGKGGTGQTFGDAIAKVRARIRPVFAQIQKTAKPLPAASWTPQAEGPVEQRIADFLTPPPTPATPAPPPSPAPAPTPIWQQATGDIALALATDKLTYTEGDLVEITVTADRDCHLRLFYLGADHQTVQIFPNQHQPEAAVKKGETVRLGGAGGAFKLRAKAPFGNEILMAVASSRPFTDAESFRFQTDMVKEFQNTNLEALSHRGIGVEAGDAPLVGRALRLYRVEARK